MCGKMEIFNEEVLSDLWWAPIPEIVWWRFANGASIINVEVSAGKIFIANADWEVAAMIVSAGPENGFQVYKIVNSIDVVIENY